MSASRGISRSAALALALLVLGAAQSGAQSAPTAREAIERARALERTGHVDDAWSYLSDLVSDEGGPLADVADVLLEAARLAGSVSDVRGLAQRAIDHTRNAHVLYAAHMLRGDSFSAEGLYQTAAVEYREAARHAPDRGPGEAELKVARTILASGDTEGAIAAYQDLVARSSADNEIRPAAELGLGTSLLAAGRAEEAARQFEETAAEYKDSDVGAQALAGAAEGYTALNDDVAAAGALARLVEAYPDSYEAALAREDLRDLEQVLSDTLSIGSADSLSHAPAR